MICKVDSCSQVAIAQCLCRKHYREARIAGTIQIKSKRAGCKVVGCTKQYCCQGYCDEHYALQRKHDGVPIRVRQHKPTAPVDRANGYRAVYVDGALVPEHRHIMEVHLGRALRKGEMVVHKNGNRSDNQLKNLAIHIIGTGGYTTRNGYRIIHKVGYDIPEHRFVMEQILGRSLLREENVHHRNGDRLDNRPENLELWSRKQPTSQRVVDKVAWAREILALYEQEMSLLAVCDNLLLNAP